MTNAGDATSRWASDVIAGVWATEGRNPHYRVSLVDLWVATDPADGVEYLHVVYDHPGLPHRTGLRQELGGPGSGVAYETALLEEVELIMDSVGEPLGRVEELLVPDAHGVHWWGAGIGPDIAEHPDFRTRFCPSCGWSPRPRGHCPQCGVAFVFTVDGELLPVPPPPEWFQRNSPSEELEVDWTRPPLAGLRRP